MNKGNIVLIYGSDIEQSEVYLVYDRNIAIGASLMGVTLLDLNKLDSNKNYKVISIKEDVSWAKKRKLNEFMVKLITKEVTPSFKERSNFLKYLHWVYEYTIGIKLLDNPVKITINNILESGLVYRH